MRMTASGPSRPPAQSISFAQRHNCPNLGERLQAGTIERSMTFESLPTCGMCQKWEYCCTVILYVSPLSASRASLLSFCPAQYASAQPRRTAYKCFATVKT